MKMVRKVLFGIAILFFLILGIGLLLPSQFHVQRQIVINASADEVFPYIVDLQKWKKWGVWFQRDPNMEITYGGEVGKVGMKSNWISDAEGSGQMEITEISENEEVIYTLYFPEFDMGSTGKLTLQQQNDKTLVVWQDYGDVGSNPINHYFAAFMDSMIGPDFETGLENLKMLVEN